ncbi:hypothetical protein SAMN06265350_101423 [Solitalea koreensis]|uniref:Uncharacterized protein n=2 Tax=Solitalea koreensis TaxID=543615 RepID=A0A521AUS0_9SPHI|nr:hypothetical protein SAMN06265350_101423 [Solitalea koreensis]
MNLGIFLAEKYKELYDFYLTMAKADNAKIVLMNSPVASKKL